MTPKNNNSVKRGKADNINGNTATDILTTVTQNISDYTAN
jgi:hypothetical protein